MRPKTSGGHLRAIVLVLFIAPWTVLWGTTSALAGILKFRRVSRFTVATWGRGIVWVAGLKLEIERRAPLDPEQNYVFMANHQSALDIPILMTACEQTHIVRFMAKESLFKIPFMGWGMRETGFIPIRRENARHSAEIFKTLLASEQVRQISYVIFPEGTRSADGRLQPFKRGTMGLAQRLARPVVPVTLCDACRANPKGSKVIRSGTIRVIFHAPLPVSDNPERADRDEMLQKVYDAVLSALPEDQRPV